MKAPKELFLSHSARNRRFATALANCLRDHGIPVWYSKTNIGGAAQWHDEIGEALRRCDWLAIVLSPAAISSEWVKHELLFALQEKQYRKHIVPILYKQCDYSALSWTLKGIEYVDFRGNHQDGYRNLLKIWGMGLKNPAG